MALGLHRPAHVVDKWRPLGERCCFVNNDFEHVILLLPLRLLPASLKVQSFDLMLVIHTLFMFLVVAECQASDSLSSLPHVGLSQYVVSDYKQAVDLLEMGIANRITAATHVHDASSRSHAIFSIQYTQVSLRTPERPSSADNAAFPFVN